MDHQFEQRKRKHKRGGRRRRRQSFLAPEEAHPSTTASGVPAASSPAAGEMPGETPSSFYRLGQTSGGERSTTSLDSQALLDHRAQPMMRPRRDSRHPQTFPSPFFDRHDRHRQKQRQEHEGEEDHDNDEDVDDRTPLIRPSSVPNSPQHARYGTDFRASSSYSHHHHVRRPSGDTTSSRRSPRDRGGRSEDYDVNNPPSIPGSPKSGRDMGYDDAVITGADFDFGTPQSPKSGRRESTVHDAVIQIDGDDGERTTTTKTKRRSSRAADSEPPSPFPPEEEETPGRHRRRRTLTLPEEDVCFPAELVAEQFGPRTSREDESGERRRRRRREWPDLAVLEEWSREEKEERSGEFRAKKISEPVLVGGRLRPQYACWRREEDEAPYRFTYFNEEFQSTIHAQTISELVQPGGSFRELFIPDPPELEDSEIDEDSSEETNHTGKVLSPVRNEVSQAGNIRHHDPSIHCENSNSGSNTTSSRKGSRNLSRSDSRFSNESPSKQPRQAPQEKPKRYGPRPVWWLDVLSPTDAEMRVIAKAFGIHALTAEDIMMQEAREKVELFRNYYFLNYRTFEQDSHSENYLQPVNMYVVVFREGVLTFHFSQTPHPANVRRRIRQLRDYLILSSDWISYALIDDITDVFGPLIQSIEDEVDDIDDTIMQMHTAEKEKEKDKDNIPAPLAPGDMLRRVGECRKKVMGMYRLLSNKADVIKGFAKRCNEQWEVAPKSEIGLYLGDIQDHIMTMTSNLTHYETLLSRAHSNYLAQINILMNERQEQTADVLGKLTVLGTIVLPMNIICGMWGMNVKVPGQDVDNLVWFWSITAGLFIFAFVSFYIAKRVYRIV